MSDKQIWMTGRLTTSQPFRADNGERQRFLPGCFAASSDLPIWCNHCSDIVISAGSTSLKLTSHGTDIEFPVFEGWKWGRDFLLAARLGRFRGMSFGYVTRESHTERDRFGEIRCITQADIFEASVVDWPRVPGTSIDFLNAVNGSTRTWKEPSNRVESVRLSKFLERTEYDFDPPAGTTYATREPASREPRRATTTRKQATTSRPIELFDPQPYIPPAHVIEKVFAYSTIRPETIFPILKKVEQ